jgi:hypothetical protein
VLTHLFDSLKTLEFMDIDGGIFIVKVNHAFISTASSAHAAADVFHLSRQDAQPLFLLCIFAYEYLSALLQLFQFDEAVHVLIPDVGVVIFELCELALELAYGGFVELLLLEHLGQLHRYRILKLVLRLGEVGAVSPKLLLHITVSDCDGLFDLTSGSLIVN